MKRLLLFIFSMLLIIAPMSFAINEFPVVADTYVASGNITYPWWFNYLITGGVSYAFNDTLNYGSDPLVGVNRLSGSTHYMVHAYLKFNTSNLTGRLIGGVYLNSEMVDASCGVEYGYYVSNTSWSESGVWYSNRPVFDGQLSARNSSNEYTEFTYFNDPYFGSTPNYERSNNLFYPSLPNVQMIGAIYDEGMVSIGLGEGQGPPTACSGAIAMAFFSKENPNTTMPVTLNLTLVDYLNGTIQNTDITAYKLYLDFETGFNSTAAFDQDDMEYIVSANRLFPNVDVYNLTMAIAAVSETPDNDLDTKISICSGGLSSYSSHYHSPNFYPNLYDYYCFNLSSSHGGKKFFGMVKIINNSNVRGNSNPEFDYYYAIMSPNYVVFTEPTFSPSPPIIGINLAVGTTTSVVLVNTDMFIRFNSSGNFTPWGQVNSVGYGEFRFSHSFILNNLYVVIADYEVYFTGYDFDGILHTSPTFTFNVTGATVPATVNTTLTGAVQSLTDGGWFPNLTEGYYFIGAIILAIITIVGLAAGGIKGAVTAAAGGIIVLGLGGLLPIYIFIPVVAIAIAFIVKFVVHLFGSGDN